MKGDRATLTDLRSVQQTVDRLARQGTVADQEDVVFDGARQLKLRSPNGTYFGIVVNDAGVLSTVNLGTTL